MRYALTMLVALFITSASFAADGESADVLACQLDAVSSIDASADEQCDATASYGQQKAVVHGDPKGRCEIFIAYDYCARRAVEKALEKCRCKYRVCTIVEDPRL
ncbi:MAG: hypothetical protein H6617_10920 [Bdellovibrionaceae bacterium]|nr:hypothetical protein [Pseudobdellovibrionaceae bacterium]